MTDVSRLRELLKEAREFLDETADPGTWDDTKAGRLGLLIRHRETLVGVLNNIKPALLDEVERLRDAVDSARSLHRNAMAMLREHAGLPARDGVADLVAEVERLRKVERAARAVDEQCEVNGGGGLLLCDGYNPARALVALRSSLGGRP